MPEVLSVYTHIRIIMLTQTHSKIRLYEHPHKCTDTVSTLHVIKMEVHFKILCSLILGAGVFVEAHCRMPLCGEPFQPINIERIMVIISETGPFIPII